MCRRAGWVRSQKEHMFTMHDEARLRPYQHEGLEPKMRRRNISKGSTKSGDAFGSKVPELQSSA